MKINSYMIGILIAYNIIIQTILSYNLYIINITNMVMMLAPVALTYIVVLYTRESMKILLNTRAVTFTLYMVFLLVGSYVVRGSESYTLYYVYDFFLYGLVPLLLIILPFKVEYVVRGVMLTSLLVYTNINYFFFSNTSDNQLTDANILGMGLSYAVLVCVIASLIHFIFYRNNAKFIDYIAYVTNLVLIIRLVNFGNRGAFLSLIIFLFLLWYIKKSENGKLSIKIISISVVVVSLALIVVSQFNTILIKIMLNLEKFNISLYSIEKTYSLYIEQGNVDNGRDTIVNWAYKLIIDSPFFGYGIGVFQEIYGTYPHNFALQLLCELGIVFSLPIFIILMKSILNIFRGERHTLDSRVFILLLFSISIPRLFFSQEFWSTPSFWLLIYFTIIQPKKSKGEYLLVTKKTRL
ncbi:O-antigen ligase [Paenibacillus castaneae]|uniref:O-antigen ligase family protein n=1 Tax=Paenibacillus castaneae TaxID=474957 RepID=UPI000C9CB697|nr:O-antigen ligase family protein [Paenibacillus castaneae]NIK78175.1 O-antigen ligase [Paenibacillus castaneae]